MNHPDITSVILFMVVLVAITTQSDAALTLGNSNSSESKENIRTSNQDISAALREALKTPDEACRFSIMKAAVKKVEPSRIPEVFEMRDSLYDEQLIRTLQSMLMIRWLNCDPKTAIEYARKLGNCCEDRGQSAAQAASLWARKDPSAAIAWVDSLPSGYMKNQARSQIAVDLAQRNPAIALEQATDIPGDQGRKAVFLVMQTWIRNDYLRAVTHISVMPGGITKDRVIASVAGGLAKIDPHTALALVLQMSPSRRKNQSLSDVASSWARKDPDDALEWANKQTNESLKESLLYGIVLSVASSDPKRALELALLLPTKNARKNGIGEALFKLTGTDPVFSLDYALNRKPPDKYEVESLLGNYLRENQSAAIEWFDTLNNPDLKAQIADNFIDSLAEADYRVAMKWHEMAKDPILKEAVTMRLLGKILNFDTQAAVAFIQSLPVGNTKDQALLETASKLVRYDPETAMNLVASVINQKAKKVAESALSQEWIKNDSSAASNWINNSQLPPEEKASLLQQHSSPPNKPTNSH